MDEDFIEIIPVEDGDVADMLEECKEKEMDYAVVLGHTKDGGYFYAASHPDPLRAMYLADQFKSYVLGNM
jgi:hypothetical protein